MDQLWLFVLHYFATPASLAGIVYGIFKILRYSEPVQRNALEWLDHPTTGAEAYANFERVRNSLVGPDFFSGRRAIALAAVASFWMFLVGIIAAINPNMVITIFAAFYGLAFRSQPITTMLLFLAVIAIANCSITLFNYLSAIGARRSGSLSLYLACLGVAMLCCFFLVHLFVELSFFLTYDIGRGAGDRPSLTRIAHALGQVASIAITDLTHPWRILRQGLDAVDGINGLLSPIDPDFGADVRSDQAYMVITARNVTRVILVVSLGILGIVYFLYAFGLSMLRVEESLMRKIYRFNKNDARGDPVWYIGLIASLVTFVFAACIQLLVIAMRHFSRSW